MSKPDFTLEEAHELLSKGFFHHAPEQDTSATSGWWATSRRPNGGTMLGAIFDFRPHKASNGAELEVVVTGTDERSNTTFKDEDALRLAGLGTKV